MSAADVATTALGTSAELQDTCHSVKYQRTRHRRGCAPQDGSEPRSFLASAAGCAPKRRSTQTLRADELGAAAACPSSTQPAFCGYRGRAARLVPSLQRAPDVNRGLAAENIDRK